MVLLVLESLLNIFYLSLSIIAEIQKPILSYSLSYNMFTIIHHQYYYLSLMKIMFLIHITVFKSTAGLKGVIYFSDNFFTLEKN